MHIVTSSNSFDLTVALRTEVSEKRLIFCKISHKFWSNFPISLVQNISELDKSRKLESCLTVDYENKIQMLLNPSIQFFIDVWGLLLIGRKGMHYVQLKFTCVLLFSYANCPRKHADIFKPSFIKKSSLPRCILY